MTGARDSPFVIAKDASPVQIDNASEVSEFKRNAEQLGDDRSRCADCVLPTSHHSAGSDHEILVASFSIGLHFRAKIVSKQAVCFVGAAPTQNYQLLCNILCAI